MRRTVLALFTFAMLAVPTAATAGGGCHVDTVAQETATTTVVIEHACFTPAAAVVRTGATVTWTNPSGLPHNISGPMVEYVELPIGVGTKVTFDKPGIYPYACMIHPGMSGVVIVRDAPATNAPAAAAPVALTTPVASSRTTSSGTSPWGWAGAGLVVVAAATLVLWRRSPAIA